MAILRNMIAAFSRRDQLAQRLYDHCVDLARAPEHYSEMSVPDTVDGRFDMLVLHLFVMAHRLKSAQPRGNRAVQSLIDAFVRDMDRNLREMGAGDIGVAKRIKHMALVLNGQLHAYEKALGEGVDSLRAGLARNIAAVSGGETGGCGIAATGHLAHYVLAQTEQLATWSDRDCLDANCRMLTAAAAYDAGGNIDSSAAQ